VLVFFFLVSTNILLEEERGRVWMVKQKEMKREN